MWITYRHVAEGRDPTPRRVDVPGQLTLIGGLFLLVLGLLRGNADGWGSAGIIAALTGAVVLLVAFVIVEGRRREPMLPLRLLSQRRFAGPQIAVFSIAASFFAVFCTSRSTCRPSSACHRSRPGWSTCPAPSWCSSHRE
jgi:hypothetical protein